MSAPRRLSHRAFGLFVAGVLLVITGVVWLASGRVVRGTLYAAATVASVALLFPGLLWPFNRFWTGVVAPTVGAVNTRVILGLLYFLILTPWALLMRLTGRDRLGLRLDRSRGSYLEPVTRQTTLETLQDVF